MSRGKGRSTKLDDKITKKICDAIKLGCTYELAANYAGIHVRTLYYWLQEGKQATRGKFFDFFQSVQEANGIGALQNLAYINQAAKDGDWRAAAWILENRHGYKRQEQREQPIIQINTSGSTDVKQLVAKVQENNQKLKQIAAPVVDLDDE